MSPAKGDDAVLKLLNFGLNKGSENALFITSSHGFQAVFLFPNDHRDVDIMNNENVMEMTSMEDNK